MNHKVLKIFGVPVIFSDREGVCEEIFSKALSGEKFRIVTLNALMMNCAFEDRRFLEILKNAVCVNDSIGISLAALLLKGKWIPRFQGIELFENILKFCEKNGFSVFFYGASDNSNRGSVRKLAAKFPGLKIAGRLNGYAPNPVEKIAAAKPDFLFVALDLPNQEKWISENFGHLDCICMGIGGTLDVVSGKIKRVNFVFRRMGLEWFFRFLKEPYRFRRIANLPVFLFRVLKRIFLKSFCFGRILL
ncbi:MAG: WecB/TagA/CpsF family glycosyltransferase [Elusimicrobia bacterium]|nr:WecB/TagA/CpsF family glycosyltransferase [Elusimicrobiota bacterium]